jgi:hypothetical protein
MSTKQGSRSSGALVNPFWFSALALLFLSAIPQTSLAAAAAPDVGPGWNIVGNIAYAPGQHPPADTTQDAAKGNPSTEKKKSGIAKSSKPPKPKPTNKHGD